MSTAGHFRSIEAAMLTHSYHDPADMQADAASQFTFLASVSGEVKERPLLMLEDCAKHLNSEQDALLSVRRAGAQRHDFVSFPTLTPEQIKDNEQHFNRALIFNGLVHTLQRDLVEALGQRPASGQLRRMTEALIHLAMFDGDFAARYKAGEVSIDKIQAYVDENWKQERETRQVWRERARNEREAFIDLYLADSDKVKLAA